MRSLCGAQAGGDDEPLFDLTDDLQRTDAAQFEDNSDAEEAPIEPAAAAAAGGDAISSDLWRPDPLPGVESAAAGSNSSSSANSTRHLLNADILTLLIELCGAGAGEGERNEALLLSDYKLFLSERLLSRPFSSPDSDAAADLFDTESELTHLELMKLRFGEDRAQLHECETMLRDMANSRRLHAQIHAAAKSGIQSTLAQSLHSRLDRLRSSDDASERSQAASEESNGVLSHALELAPYFLALLLSSEYWPGVDEDEGLVLRLPVTLQSVLDASASSYHALKTPRVLEWESWRSTRQGCVVSVDIERPDGRMLRVECDPAQLAILDAFAERADGSEQTSWTLSAFTVELHCDDEDALRARAAFWVSRGLLLQSTNGDEEVVFTLVEAALLTDADDAKLDVADEADAAGAAIGGDKQRAQIEAQIEAYLLGAIGNNTASAHSH